LHTMAVATAAQTETDQLGSFESLEKDPLWKSLYNFTVEQ